MKKFFSATNPYRDLLYITTAVVFILSIVLYKSSLTPPARHQADEVEALPMTTQAHAVIPQEPEVAHVTIEASGIEKNQMNLQSFRDLTMSAQERLPTLEQIQKLPPAEVHAAPVLIREAGLVLSQIAQALHDNENLASEAAAFYEDCYARVDLPVSIRGLCLADHRNIRVQWGDRAEWTNHEAQQPASVLRLAEVIPATSRAE